MILSMLWKMPVLLVSLYKEWVSQTITLTGITRYWNYEQDVPDGLQVMLVYRIYFNIYCRMADGAGSQATSYT